MWHDARKTRFPARRAAPYTALAEGYETVMDHVDYRRWAGHAHHLLQKHGPAEWPLGPRRLLELGCGTGALARRLQPRGPYRYLATDRSEDMLAVARRKARAQSVPLRFRQVDFTALPEALPEAERPFDAVMLLYDGLNYLLEEDSIRRLLEGVAQVLRPGGLFLFDQTTPANSADPTAFEDEGTFDEEGQVIHYRRESRYDPACHVHTTLFHLEGPGGEHVTECHVQRAYPLSEIHRLLHASPLAAVARYDGFTTEAATPQSRRVHWLARA